MPLPSVSLRSPFVARTYIMYSPYSYYSFLSLSFFSEPHHRCSPGVFTGLRALRSLYLGDMCT